MGKIKRTFGSPVSLFQCSSISVTNEKWVRDSTMGFWVEIHALLLNASSVGATAKALRHTRKVLAKKRADRRTEFLWGDALSLWGLNVDLSEEQMVAITSMFMEGFGYLRPRCKHAIKGLIKFLEEPWSDRNITPSLDFLPDCWASCHESPSFRSFWQEFGRDVVLRFSESAYVALEVVQEWLKERVDKEEPPIHLWEYRIVSQLLWEHECVFDKQATVALCQLFVKYGVLRPLSEENMQRARDAFLACQCTCRK